jgi:hypothetical protein
MRERHRKPTQLNDTTNPPFLFPLSSLSLSLDLLAFRLDNEILCCNEERVVTRGRIPRIKFRISPLLSMSSPIHHPQTTKSAPNGSVSIFGGLQTGKSGPATSDGRPAANQQISRRLRHGYIFQASHARHSPSHQPAFCSLATGNTPLVDALCFSAGLQS